MKLVVTLLLIACTLQAAPFNSLFIEGEDGASLQMNDHRIDFTQDGKIYLENNKEKLNLLRIVGMRDKSNFKIEQAAPMFVTKADESKTINIGESIIYKDVYQNIDLRFRSANEGIKYDFIIHPGGNIEDIKMEINPIYKDLFCNSSSEIRSFVIDGNHKEFVSSAIEIEKSSISFKVDNYDKSKTLLIDPTIEISLIYGDSDNGYGGQIEKDSQGNLYYAMKVSSEVIPVTKRLGDAPQQWDVCVLKYDANLNLQWGKYFGGSSNEYPMDLVVDKSDNIWVSGETSSYDFPTTPQKDLLVGNTDMFATKISKDGDILFSITMGSVGYDAGQEIAIDSQNRAWVFGRVYASPVSPALLAQNYHGFYDAYLWCVDENGVHYATCIGTDSTDFAEGIVIDDNDNMYLTGYTYSSEFPILNATDSVFAGETEAFLMKLSPTGNLIWSTFVGGIDKDWGQNLAIDHYGDIILMGFTKSDDLKPATQINTGMDAFLSKYDSNGNLIWRTIIGGTQDEGLDFLYDMYGGLKITSTNSIVFGGRTASPDFPIVNSNGYFHGDRDAFICSINTMGVLEWSTLIGGVYEDGNVGIEVDPFDRIVATGYTNSVDFPSTNPDYMYMTGYDPYLVRFGSFCDPIGFNMETESSESFYLTGESRSEDNSLILTNKENSSIWFDKYLPLADGFSTQFQFSISPGENSQTQTSKNSFVFVINNDLDNNELNSFEIKFNSNISGEKTEGSESTNDVIKSKVEVSSLSTDNKQINIEDFDIKSDGTVYNCLITYSSSLEQMIIYLGENNSELQEVSNVNLDLQTIMELEDDMSAAVGFTAAVKSENNTYTQISQWQLCPYNQSAETSIEENANGYSANKESSVSIYPNPAISDINISYNTEQSSYVNINMYDLEGKKVAMLYSGLDQAGTQTISMPLPQNLSAGVYVIEIDYGYNKETAKLIVE